MAFVKKAVKFVTGGGLLGLGLKAVLGGGKKKAIAQPGAPLVATRDDAAATLAAEDALRRRRGGAADILNGERGAEAALNYGKLAVLGS